QVPRARLLRGEPAPVARVEAQVATEAVRPAGGPALGRVETEGREQGQVEVVEGHVEVSVGVLHRLARVRGFPVADALADPFDDVVGDADVVQGPAER